MEWYTCESHLVWPKSFPLNGYQDMLIEIECLSYLCISSATFILMLSPEGAIICIHDHLSDPLRDGRARRYYLKI